MLGLQPGTVRLVAYTSDWLDMQTDTNALSHSSSLGMSTAVSMV
jgi:hypothetical protein